MEGGESLVTGGTAVNEGYWIAGYDELAVARVNPRSY
jgi:hypothetical protein